jgi:hypothetical protein
MAWPSPSDYQDAIQNPRLCFNVPELQAAEAARTPLGLPRVASGNFASVYEMRGPAGRWAVRCFLRPVTDQERRYQAISDHLNQLHAAGDGAARWLVDFDYHREGIRVRGTWYPIVTMDWVAGAPLHRHVEELVDQAERALLPNAGLLALAHQWRALVAEVRAAGIAHNDYQHGNILVAGGEMKLVDYDGMYVPAFRGERSPELGRANYQHPARRPEDYGPELDNFSAIVIYLALRALAFAPELWRFHDGDNLVLTAGDFRSPSSSAAFAALRGSKDEEVRALASRLASCCVLPLAQVPALEAAIAAAAPGSQRPRPVAQSSTLGAGPARPASVPPTTAAPGGRASAAPSTGATPAVGSTAGRAGAGVPSGARAAAGTAAGGADWVRTHLGRGAPPAGTAPVAAPASQSPGAAAATAAPAPAAGTPPATAASGTGASAAARRSHGGPTTPATAATGAPATRRARGRATPAAPQPAGPKPPSSAPGRGPAVAGRRRLIAPLARAFVRLLSMLLTLAFLGAVIYGWWAYEQGGGRIPWLQTTTEDRRSTDDQRPDHRAPRGGAPNDQRPTTRRQAPSTRPSGNAGASLLQEAKTHVALGQYSDAMAALEGARAAGLDLTQPGVAREYYGVLGRLRLERGEFREALAPLREALHRSPSDPGLLLDYGRALEKLNRAEPARAAYRRVLQSASASPDQIAQARAGLGRLR